MVLNVCDLALQAAVVKGPAVAPSDTPNDGVFRLDKVFLSVCATEASVGDGTITLPVFKSLTRERFVAEVEVPAANPNQVLLSSAAFVFNA
jgi:hypothetical protein